MVGAEALLEDLQGFAGLTAEDGGGRPVYARGVEAREDEVFRIWKVRGSGTIHRSDEVAFQACSGQYLAAEPGTLKVTATGSAIEPAETFQVLLLPE